MTDRQACIHQTDKHAIKDVNGRQMNVQNEWRDSKQAVE
jgi:hypothetical protein